VPASATSAAPRAKPKGIGGRAKRGANGQVGAGLAQVREAGAEVVPRGELGGEIRDNRHRWLLALAESEGERDVLLHPLRRARYAQGGEGRPAEPTTVVQVGAGARSYARSVSRRRDHGRLAGSGAPAGGCFAGRGLPGGFQGTAEDQVGIGPVNRAEAEQQLALAGARHVREGGGERCLAVGVLGGPESAVAPAQDGAGEALVVPAALSASPTCPDPAPLGRTGLRPALRGRLPTPLPRHGGESPPTPRRGTWTDGLSRPGRGSDGLVHTSPRTECAAALGGLRVLHGRTTKVMSGCRLSSPASGMSPSHADVKALSTDAAASRIAKVYAQRQYPWARGATVRRTSAVGGKAASGWITSWRWTQGPALMPRMLDVQVDRAGRMSRIDVTLGPTRVELPAAKLDAGQPLEATDTHQWRIASWARVPRTHSLTLRACAPGDAGPARQAGGAAVTRPFPLLDAVTGPPAVAPVSGCAEVAMPRV
jgi:hypothetical protein